MGRRVVYYPSRKEFVDYLVRVVEPPSGAKILDVGCGDARVLEGFGRKYDDIFLYGIDIRPGLVDISRSRLSRYGGRARVYLRDMYKESFDKYDIVYAYLTKDALSHLRSKVVRLLMSGGLFIAHDYPVPGLEPIKIHLVDLDGDKHYIFVYYDKNRVRRDLVSGLRL